MRHFIAEIVMSPIGTDQGVDRAVFRALPPQVDLAVALEGGPRRRFQAFRAKRAGGLQQMIARRAVAKLPCRLSPQAKPLRPRPGQHHKAKNGAKSSVPIW